MDIHVLICDDDPAFVQKMKRFLQAQRVKSDVSVHIVGTSSPATLTDQVLGAVDLLFLDVDMGEYNGITIARRLRALRSNALLIFVTNYVQYSPEGYEVAAFRFLLKSELKTKLSVYYHEALAQLCDQKDWFEFTLSGEKYSVDIDNILYLKSEKRVLLLHLLRKERVGEYFYSTLETVQNQLCDKGFLRAHKSYLVNMAHIQKLTYGKVVLCNQEELPVSERSFSQIKNHYLHWKGNN